MKRLLSQNRLLAVVLLVGAPLTQAFASWDGEPSLDDIVFSFESFVDINAYQFRPSEEVDWYGVENGFRATGGSLDHNLLYTYSDLRLKQPITSNVNFRMRWEEEEFYESREQQRPLLEIEARGDAWPASLSLIGTPEYAKSESDLGLAVTLGERPWNYLHVTWLKPDLYYNEKNTLGSSYYRTEPEQWRVEGGYKWGERYKLHFRWQENRPLSFVLDDMASVFAYKSSSYRASLDYSGANNHNYGVSLRGLDTRQRLDEGSAYRAQDIRYLSLEAYWFTLLEGRDEWTLGLRYDEFENVERSSGASDSSFDFLYKTHQAYSVYRHPFRPNQAWLLGLYVGRATKGNDYVSSAVDDTIRDKTEAKLTTVWELFSAARSSTLNVMMSWNLDDIETDPVDGGMMRFSTRF